jgi:hypothetical protein
LPRWTRAARAAGCARSAGHTATATAGRNTTTQRRVL